MHDVIRGRAGLIMGLLVVQGVLGCGETDDTAPGGSGGTGGGSHPEGGEGGVSSATCPDVPGASDEDKTPAGCSGASCFGCAYPVESMPFIQGAFAVTDASGSTATITTRPGKACLSGKSASWSILVLQLGEFVGQPGPPFGQDIPFDAAALGVTQVKFTIDSPPEGGVVPGVSGPVMSSECNCSSVMGFEFPSGPVTPDDGLSQTLVLPLTGLESDGYSFSPGSWLGLQFNVGPEPSYDFCVSDVALLDAMGEAVSPP